MRRLSKSEQLAIREYWPQERREWPVAFVRALAEDPRERRSYFEWRSMTLWCARITTMADEIQEIRVRARAGATLEVADVRGLPMFMWPPSAWSDIGLVQAAITAEGL